MKDDKLIDALDGIDDEILADAAPRIRASRMPAYRIAAIAACLTLVVGVVIATVGLGGGGGVYDYYENPEFMSAMLDYMNSNNADVIGGANDAPGGGDDSGGMPNGNYMEITDNQLSGIIEGDLAKATDKYLFRLGGHTLYIYTLDGTESKILSTYTLPDIGSENGVRDMFLSADGRTVTIFTQTSGGTFGTTNIFSVDVSNAASPKEKSVVSFDGSKSIVRRIGDKFYLVTNHYFEKNRIDLENPASFVPSINYGDERHICAADRIVSSGSISRVYYRYLTVLNEGDLSLADELALMELGDLHFTENNIIVNYQYYKNEEMDGKSVSRCYSKIGVIDISDGLSWRGDFTIVGWADDKNCFDERDGMLRIVASTSDRAGYTVRYDSASLYVYDLESLSQIAAVEGFAPYGEGVTAARFEGDKLYVCTADVLLYTDPVFFFDLSDYSNITYADTGFIDGFSSSLIDYGEGYLLGIGREDGGSNKLEVYKREGDQVVTVDKYVFSGSPTTEYKSFLIDREENLFGISVSKYSYNGSEPINTYLIFSINDGRISLVSAMGTSSAYARAFEYGGFVYMTVPDTLYIKAVSGNAGQVLAGVHVAGEWVLVKESACGERGVLERSCSCGRVSTKLDYTTDSYTSHQLIDGICSLCGKDVGSANKNADFIIYTSRGDGTCYVSGTKKQIFGVVEIPTYSPRGDKVVEIGAGAFMSCGIEAITLPNSVKTVSDYAFSSSILKHIDLGKVEYIGKGAFSYCQGLRSVSFSSKLKEIGDAAFYFCESLEEIHLPDSVNHIGDSAFAFCKELKSVRLPARLTALGTAVFNNCNALREIALPQTLSSIGEYAFNMCHELISITIPDKVTSLGKRTFADCRRLVSITLGSGLTEIASDAFEECVTLVTIINKSALDLSIGSDEHGGVAKYAKYVGNAEATFTYLDGYLFLTVEGQNYLIRYDGTDTMLTLPSSFKGESYDIFSYAFYNRDDLISVTLPDGVREIGDRAFYGCTNLAWVVLPDSVERIGKYAFGHCKFTRLDLPTGLTEIDDAAFWNCNKLVSITLPDGLVRIGDSAFYSCNKLVSITLPDGLVRIGDSAFYSCYALTTLKIPESVKEIGAEAFAVCKALTKVVLPEGLTHIGKNTFNNCSSMHTVIIPSTVSEIEDAFYACYKLRNFYFRGSEQQWNAVNVSYNNGLFNDVQVVYNYTAE